MARLGAILPLSAPCPLPILTLAGKLQRQLVLTGTLAALALLQHQLTWENHLDPTFRTTEHGLKEMSTSNT